MSVSQLPCEEFSIHVSSEDVMVTIHGDTLGWRVSDIMNQVRPQFANQPQRNIIVNLVDVGELSDRILKVIWQLARTTRMNHSQLQCIVPDSIPAPALEILAANGIIELLDHRAWAIDDLESDNVHDSICRESIKW